MKLIKTLSFALLTLSAGTGCSESSPETGTGGSGATLGTGGVATGGSTTGGTAGMTGGSGATPSTGGVATGGTGGTGGTAGTGGVATGGTGGTAGTGGAGGATGSGGSGELTGDTLLPGMDGLFWPFRAKSGEAPTDAKSYWLTATPEECTAEGLMVTKEYQATGTPGQSYTVNFEVRGAVSLRCYEGGTPMAMTPDAAGINQAFYTGGAPSGESLLSTVELAITPAGGTEATSSYFLNGIPSSSAMCDTGITYDVGYKGSFMVMGDGKVTLSAHFPDCTALQNCGADTASCAPRTVNVDDIEVRASSPQPVSDVFFINDAQVDVYPQWLVLDIQSVTTP